MKIFAALNMLVAAFVVAGVAQAHDPDEASKGMEKADCAKFNGMDHSKMDMKDPVMQAMMTQCAAAKKHGHADSDDEHKNMHEHHQEMMMDEDSDMPMHHDHQQMMKEKTEKSSKEHKEHKEHKN